jgi:hypothetical protein
MKPTYASRPVQVFDIPVPSKPEVKFTYNFFEADERVDDKPPFLKKPLSALTPREISIKIPRYVTISWKKSSFDPRRSSEFTYQKKFLENNALEITDESKILTDFSMLYFQDFDYLNRVGERFESSARLRGLASGSNTDIASKLMVSRAANSSSALDASGDNSMLASQGNYIQRFLSLATQNRSLFISGDQKIEPVDASSADQLAIIVDNDYLLNASRESKSSPVSSCASQVRNNSRMMAGSMRKRRSKMANLSELETEMSSIEDIPTESTSAAEKVQHLGYMIERFEIGSGDRVGSRRNFYISSPNICSYVDLNIKYGVQYVYSIRSIAAFFVTAVDENTRLQKSKFLVASRPSTFTSILTEEYAPPPAPADLNFYWDYQRAALQINWAFPSNPQQDIKGWQVFRRKSISDPFELIVQLDFDDSVIKTPSAEVVDKSLVKKFNSSITFYVEPEFNKDSDFIYAVCSMDAHAMTSNYSVQFRVRFDRIQNRLIKHLVSESGAAKQYPNTYLKAELSLDSVKSTKIEKMRIFFDPEYLVVKDRNDRDLKFLKTDSRGGLYRFSLLNTDRQLQANFDVFLKDLRNLRQDRSSGKD